MWEILQQGLADIQVNSVINIFWIAIVLDTVLGSLRAIKQREFNSAFGIDGALRKIGMVVSMIALYFIDGLLHVNLTPFLSEDILQYINLTTIGPTELFGILFITCECLSILKNLSQIGIPYPKKLKTFLEKMTKEIQEEKQ